MWRKVWKKMWTILIALGLGLREDRLQRARRSGPRGAYSPPGRPLYRYRAPVALLPAVAGEARSSAGFPCPRRCLASAVEGLAVSAAPTQAHPRTELALHLSRDPRLELDGIQSDHLVQLRQGQRSQQLT